MSIVGLSPTSNTYAGIPASTAQQLGTPINLPASYGSTLAAVPPPPNIPYHSALPSAPIAMPVPVPGGMTSSLNTYVRKYWWIITIPVLTLILNWYFFHRRHRR